MNKPNDGGPAFPPTGHSGKEHGHDDICWHSGMSLRAHFAGKAMQGLIASEVDGHEWSPSLYKRGALLAGKLAQLSCAAADALIAELEGKDAEFLGPEGTAAFKFEEGDKVRLREGELIRFDGNEGVVKGRRWRSEGLWAYDLSVLVKGKPGRVWIPEDKLEPAPKFEVRDPVWVKADAMGKFAGEVAVVESVTAGRGGRWVYEVSVRERGEILESYYEEWLEAIEDEEPPFKKGDRVRVKLDAQVACRGDTGVVDTVTRGSGLTGRAWAIGVQMDKVTITRLPLFNAADLEAVGEGE